MKRLILSASALALPVLALSALAADPPKMDEAASMSYALGYQLGRDLVGTEVRNEALLQGVTDGRSGTPARLNPEEMQAALTALEGRINEQRAKAQAEASQKAAAAGAAYLADNARREGVTTTASGLQYRIVKPGAGRTPTANDTVTVHYRGTLVDGTEFDSSYKRGQPATFPVGGVIAGWTEALQLMQEGAQYQLVIPPSLAYGDRGPLAGQVLIFDVELLSATAEAQAK
ncbi:MAG: FKBP-type peptidyl-prolyl cis-trans isomerase [Steroidobacteraceae bacterium]|nr:FKBP-type peptidyl-prolyl cis-trans isomerase [Steroidobacteraceae bacterium]